MKCIRCDHDSKYSERTGGICPKCNGRFAFEPKSGDPFTDRGFQSAIGAVSGDGTVKFLPSHVWYQLNRPGGESLLPAAFVTALALAAAMGVAVVAIGLGGAIGGLLCIPPALSVVGIPMGLMLKFGTPRVTTTVPRPAFDAAWTRWLEVHGRPVGAIESAGRLLAARPPALETELRSYSFDRAVICDTPDLVDLLIANRFHFENNCAVLSEDGYPEAAFATVRAMLANNPHLLVLAVHDATPDGCRLAHRLANDPEWFAGGTARVVDVGLRPAHAKSFRGKVRALSTAHPVSADAAITTREARWLSKYMLETAAIRPEQLVKRLYRAMTAAESGAWTGGSDGVFFLGDTTSTVDGGSDSFG